jgi:hypothetical protein
MLDNKDEIKKKEKPTRVNFTNKDYIYRYEEKEK